MRIDLWGATGELGLEPVASAKPPVRPESDASSVPMDTASLSAHSLSVPALTAGALASADTRAEKVETLRQAVATSTYTLDPNRIAQAMINEWM